MRRRAAGQFVGFSCRVIAFSDKKPDMEFPPGMNSLNRNCRVCRVFTAGESAGEIVTAHLSNRTTRFASGRPLRRSCAPVVVRSESLTCSGDWT